MKRLSLLLLFLFSLSGYSQYSKKELKKLKKLDVKITNKGLDLKADFVFLNEWKNSYSVSWESYMNNILFEKKFGVGSYYFNKETNTNVFNARYVIKGNPSSTSFSIKDLTTNKLIAIIRWKKRIMWSDSNRYKFDYIFDKLIESNN
jgi:hypothetical protein